MKIFISLAVSATMFPERGQIDMRPLTILEVEMFLQHPTLESALNPSHKTTIDAVYRKYGLQLPVPEKAPKVSLEQGDSLIIIQANLPRLAEGEVHSDEIVENASISFRLWSVIQA